MKGKLALRLTIVPTATVALLRSQWFGQNKVRMSTVKSLIPAVVVAAALATPVISFAQSNASVTRAPVRAELVHLKKASYTLVTATTRTIPKQFRPLLQDHLTDQVHVALDWSASTAPDYFFAIPLFELPDHRFHQLIAPIGRGLVIDGRFNLHDGRLHTGLIARHDGDVGEFSAQRLEGAGSFLKLPGQLVQTVNLVHRLPFFIFDNNVILSACQIGFALFK